MAHVVYVSNARFPTDKAHGFAIAKMCEALGRAGHEVELWAPRQGAGRPDLRDRDLFDYYGVQRVFSFRPLPVLRIEGLRRTLPAGLFSVLSLARGQLRALIAALRTRGTRADLFWTRDPVVAFWLSALGRPILFEGHSIPLKARRGVLESAVKRRSFRGALVLTRALADQMSDLGVPRDRIRVWPNAVDVEMFAGAAAKETGDDVDPVVGYVGRFVSSRGHDKGVPRLIDAVASIHARGNERPRLVCVGGPLTEVPALTARAEAAGLDAASLSFHDRVPPADLPVWMGRCDVLVIPWWDRPDAESPAPPLKLFEYMAAGAAIVAADLSEIGDYLQHEVNGLIVDRDDTEAMSLAIERLLRDPDLRRRLGERARVDARRFSWDERVATGLQLAGIS